MAGPTPLEFKVSTGLKDIIGRELITDDQIAIFELVKNSYDADAQKVVIEFKNVKHSDSENKPRIVVVDNGIGMSYNDIVGKWLFVGFSEKKLPPEAELTDFRDKITKRKRIFVGAKGIGRFSADRLGSKMRLLTKTRGAGSINLLDVDWTKFQKDQNDKFEKVDVFYSAIRKLPFRDKHAGAFERGTIVEISELRDSWDRAKLVKLKRYLQRLVDPLQVEGTTGFKIILDAPEFLAGDRGKPEHERINSVIRNTVFQRVDKKTTKIECQVDTGTITTRLTDKGRLVFRFTERNSFSGLHDVKVLVFYLNPASKRVFTRTMGLEPKNYGSIFLYKNGFRIHPYGDENNDWLGLDRRKTQAYARNLGNREVIGRIEVNGLQPGFSEVSSRAGGVVETPELHMLIDPRGLFLEKVLKRLESYVVEAIRWDSEDLAKKRSPEEVKAASINIIQKVVGNVKDPEKDVEIGRNLLTIFQERQVEKLPELVRNVESITKFVKSEPERDYIKRQLSAVREAARVLSSEVAQKGRELEVKKREAIFLQKSLSTDKRRVEDLVHAIGVSSSSISNLLWSANDLAARGESVSKILTVIDQIRIENEKIKVFADIVDHANFNLQVSEINKDLVEYIRQYLESNFAARTKGMRLRFEGEDIAFTRTFRPLEVSIVLDNLVDNSFKAKATSMGVRFEVSGGLLHVYLSDNGKGVEEENQEFLFGRGYTTTDGSGIGLHNIRTIMKDMGGSISFAGNHFDDLETGACFELTFG